ncbi:MAG: MerR family transcriptional regulator [Hyphomicrobiales bacterium]|nr:MerR family transcriptional regulator [Hyphomicrobiales bacterium]
MTKSPDAFRTISEVADDLALPQHVLRFWETRFSQIKPMKRGGGRRYYRPEDIDLLGGIQFLLYEKGYTIKGVQRILKDNGNKYVIAAGKGEDLAVFHSSQSAQKPSARDTAESGDGKVAVSVNEVIQSNAKPVKNKGLFGKFSSRDIASATSPDSLDLSSDDKKQLQSTLYDLLECKRLLDQSR